MDVLTPARPTGNTQEPEGGCIWDANGNQMPDPGEPQGAYGGTTPSAVVVNGANMTGISFTISDTFTVL